MLAFLLKRVMSAALLVLFISLVSFALVFAAGDPAISLAGQAGSAADAEKIRDALGLDRPVYRQYLEWAARALRGEFGNSLRYDQPVARMVVDSFKITFLIGACAMVLSVSLAIALGVLAARHRGGLIDRAVLLLSVTAQSMPSFCLALLGIIILSVEFPLLPSSGADTWRHLVLPVAVLAFYALPAVLRLTRAGMVETLSQDFIRTSRAMGIGERRILYTYALRNALLPVVVVAAAQFGYMLSGSIVVESVFAIYGAGRLSIDSVLGGDLPVLQALVLGFSLIYVVLTLLADLAVAWLDPRARG